MPSSRLAIYSRLTDYRTALISVFPWMTSGALGEWSGVFCAIQHELVMVTRLTLPDEASPSRAPGDLKRAAIHSRPGKFYRLVFREINHY